MEVRRVINCQNCEKLQNIIAGHLKTIVCLREEIKSLKELHLDHGSEFEPQFDIFSAQNPPEEVAESELINDNVNVKTLEEQKLIQECKTKRLVICIKKLPVMHHNSSKFKLVPLSKTSYDGLKLNKIRTRNVEKPKTIESSPPPTKIMTKNQDIKPYSFNCTICSAAESTGNITNFKSYKGLTSHFSTYHPSSEIPEIAYTCSEPGCGASFATIDQIKYHLNIHTEKFKCPECQSCFARIRELWAHQKTEHTISGVKTNFCCDKCGKILSNKWGLTLHLRLVHENHRPHACTSCPKSFSSLCYLKLHEESHMANLSIKCSKCENTFKTRNSLYDHVYRVHRHSDDKNEMNNTNNTCPHCSKVLKDRVGLRLHIKRVHQKLERKFKCDFDGCEWSFPYKRELENHKSVHLSVQEQTELKLQQKRFVCELCGLSLRGHIKTHMKRHANNSGPFACQIDNCWRRYENEKSLKIHQRNHTNPNPKMNFKSGPKISKVFLNKMLTNDKS